MLLRHLRIRLNFKDSGIGSLNFCHTTWLEPKAESSGTKSCLCVRRLGYTMSLLRSRHAVVILTMFHSWWCRSPFLGLCWLLWFLNLQALCIQEHGHCNVLSCNWSSMCELPILTSSDSYAHGWNGLNDDLETVIFWTATQWILLHLLRSYVNVTMCQSAG